jgi:methionine-rich copper-binding protein CopC/putative copper export protein
VTPRRALLAAGVALAALLGGGAAPASAHPIPIQATPEPGVVTQKADTSVSIALSEPAVARGSHVRVFGPAGRTIAVGPVRASAGGRVLTVKPRRALASAVYVVRWSALGNDGHIVTGSFRFGVAGTNGVAPPGAAALTGAGERPGIDQAVDDDGLRVLGRSLGILAASTLLGGLLLVRRLRRGGEFADSTSTSLISLYPMAWLLVAVSATAGVISGATSGSSGGFDPGLLLAVPTAVADLVRLILVAVVSVILVAVRRRGDVFVESAYLGGALAVLATYAISGHALSEPSFLAILGILVHVLAASVWLGGVGAIAFATIRSKIDVRVALRAYAPIAVRALGLAILTGVLVAIREVGHWYFLRWSDYGRVVLIKTLFVLIIVVIGAAAWRRAGAGRSARSLIRLELVGVLVVLGLAVTLAGQEQGREQPLPAQDGSLFAGPAVGTVFFGESDASVGLAPARTGANVITVGVAPESREPRTVSVRLTSPARGAKIRVLHLQRHGGRTWSAPVALKTPGRWFAQVKFNGRTTPKVPLQVGVPRAPGSTPIDVLAVADLTGPAAERCRAHIIGLELALARINAEGGLDGGRKVAPLVLDSGGTAVGATKAAARGLAAKPIASAGTCGTGGSSAVGAIARAGVPNVVGDPAVDPVDVPRVHRLAADPYVQGVAFGQLVQGRILPAGQPGVRVIRVAASDDVQGRRLVAGLRVGLKNESIPPGYPALTGPAPTIVRLKPGELAALSDADLTQVLDIRRTSALIIDEPDAGGADTRAIERIGASRGQDLLPPPVLLSERVLSESVVRAAGALGRIGAVQGVSEVSTNTRDAALYQAAVPVLYRGEIASIDGLRGYATGLALRDALREGITADDIGIGLNAPKVFTDALLAPWSRRIPGAGSPNVVAVQPQFIAPTLVPTSAGGEAKDTEYFPQGGWTVTTPTALGILPGLEQPKLGR